MRPRDSDNLEIGHVEDVMVDLESWTIRYMVIDTSNWIGGRTVLVSPEWVRRHEARSLRPFSAWRSPLW